KPRLGALRRKELRLNCRLRKIDCSQRTGPAGCRRTARKDACAPDCASASAYSKMFFITAQSLDRREAIRRINLIAGKDLRAMADEYKIGVWRNSRENKGWAGQVIERYLGLPQNSRQAPDFGDWELKVVPLRKDASGNLRVKESMAITMLEPAEVVANNFEDSHLYDKLRSMVVVSRVWESKEELHSILHAAAEFDLDNSEIRKQVVSDYESIRAQIWERGIDSVTGDLGKLVQARTKGPGHGSTSRAFYARPIFVAHILNLQKLAWMPRVFFDDESEPRRVGVATG
ncbi:MAG TPA: MvaI/BcnI family restriction endonuclease, partial [Pyrinomonadaceae bacterium]|nr:MvaI/BcnI family restriction endonuclease [Pyrinomonadaceae bacterium]